MKTTSAKVVGSVAGSILLASAGIAAAVPAMQVAGGGDSFAYAAVDNEVADEAGDTAVQVQGSFDFTQDTVSETSEISGVFSKAVASLCAGMPEYGISAVKGPLTITGGVTLEATVEEMQADDAAEAVLMACACASNVAGGGATVNASASGVSLATVASLAQAL